MADIQYYGTGRRKTSTARVYLRPGNGDIVFYDPVPGSPGHASVPSPESSVHRLVRAAMSQLNLSARAYHRTLKLARTLADLAGSEHIQVAHVAEALQYRPKGTHI